MSNTTITIGEHLYDVTAKITKITEFGTSLMELAAGQINLPLQGARFDAAFEGTGSGPKIKFSVTGVDYLNIRADGRNQLHIHAEITTEDGAKISFFGDGIFILEEGATVAQLRESVTLTTSYEAYSWVNQLQIWAHGTLDIATQEINVKGYAV
jgi:hypothetical protein